MLDPTKSSKEPCTHPPVSDSRSTTLQKQCSGSNADDTNHRSSESRIPTRSTIESIAAAVVVVVVIAITVGRVGATSSLRESDPIACRRGGNGAAAGSDGRGVDGRRSGGGLAAAPCGPGRLRRPRALGPAWPGRGWAVGLTPPGGPWAVDPSCKGEC